MHSYRWVQCIRAPRASRAINLIIRSRASAGTSRPNVLYKDCIVGRSIFQIAVLK